MLKLKKLALATATAGIVSLSPLPVLAEQSDIGRQLSEARQEGSIWTAIALNRHLSPFSIEVEVVDGTATLTGVVESEVDRDLAGEIARGIEGIEEVDNKLLIDSQARSSDQQSDFAGNVRDATITASIKSRLLWNRHTEGLDIDVNTEGGVVSLKGNSQSSEARDLAGQIAANTDGVREVKNQIEITDAASTADRAKAAVADATDAVSDTWITSKIKSSFIFSRNLSGLDIEVETVDGQVTLSGEVDTPERKSLAEETAGNIRGVRSVDASGLRVAE